VSTQGHTTKGRLTWGSKGIFMQKPLGHSSGKSLNFHGLGMSWSFALGVHEGNYGLQPIHFNG
jgi:hypothetical protein